MFLVMATQNIIILAAILKSISALYLIYDNYAFASSPQQRENTTHSLMSVNETLYFNGHNEAGHEYSNYLSTQADTGFNGAPHSMSYSHVFSSKQTETHDSFAQGYYGFFGMDDNYTKTHYISGIRMIQYQTPDGAMFGKEGIIFTNGTEIVIPEQNIGFYHGHLPIF